MHGLTDEGWEEFKKLTTKAEMLKFSKHDEYFEEEDEDQ